MRIPFGSVSVALIEWHGRVLPRVLLEIWAQQSQSRVDHQLEDAIIVGNVNPPEFASRNQASSFLGLPVIGAYLEGCVLKHAAHWFAGVLVDQPAAQLHTRPQLQVCRDRP